MNSRLLLLLICLVFLFCSCAPMTLRIEISPFEVYQGEVYSVSVEYSAPVRSVRLKAMGWNQVLFPDMTVPPSNPPSGPAHYSRKWSACYFGENYAQLEAFFISNQNGNSLCASQSTAQFSYNHCNNSCNNISSKLIKHARFHG